MSHNVKWRMQKAARLLLEGNSSTHVSEMLKVRRETLSRWKKHAVFIAEYERVRTEICEDMRMKLWRMAIQTFDDTCESLMDGDMTRLRFNNALKFFKTLKIEQIFSPNPPAITPQAAALEEQTLRMERAIADVARKKPIAEQLHDITNEILDREGD